MKIAETILTQNNYKLHSISDEDGDDIIAIKQSDI